MINRCALCFRVLSPRYFCRFSIRCSRCRSWASCSSAVVICSAVALGMMVFSFPDSGPYARHVCLRFLSSVMRSSFSVPSFRENRCSVCVLTFPKSGKRPGPVVPRDSRFAAQGPQPLDEPERFAPACRIQCGGQVPRRAHGDTVANSIEVRTSVTRERGAPRLPRAPPRNTVSSCVRNLSDEWNRWHNG